MSKREKILNELEPLFAEAEKNGLWFRCLYQDMWFTPQELREAHKEDRFVWGACNWELKNPQEIIDQLNARVVNMVKNINAEIESIKQKM